MGGKSLTREGKQVASHHRTECLLGIQDTHIGYCKIKK